MVTKQVTLGPISEEIAIDSVGSFKITLIVSSNHETTAFPFGFTFFAVIMVVLFSQKHLREFS
jgi:hypothetical protein